MNIFVLAEKQLEREGLLGKSDVVNLLIDRAITIRRWLDMQNRNQKVARNRWEK